VRAVDWWPVYYGEELTEAHLRDLARTSRWVLVFVVPAYAVALFFVL
jgi:hypothetical protein